MTMTERIRCSVPFCGRTTKRPCAAWVCGDHWKLVPRKERAVLARAKRKMRRKGLEWNEAADRIWERCKRIAIERAVGL